MHKLSILISTYKERISAVKDVVKHKHPSLSYIVVHQVETELFQDEVQKLCHDRPDIHYIALEGMGLAKSRNVAIANAVGDYILIMDDDVTLKPDIYQLVINAFDKQEKADLITFQIADTDTGALLKDYPKDIIVHNRKTILKTGSIEMACKLESLRNSRVCFPEYLGAGTSLPACEEPVFLSRLIDKKLRLESCPQVIGYHPKLSSGKVFNTEEALLCRGVAFRQIFGVFLGIPAICYFYLKNRSKFQLEGKFSFILLLKGYFMPVSK
ncbi:glycosyltransferase family 2 protein [Shewanella mesophila]|uniref:glycosyltransferase n=1 Tax=Shewanella mesophila TaxID=2864208 RepID=UPI001C65B54C|nr:glycosyltransferase family 2 protein [Shewanella mesophila]QYJ85014.1 glycosyltransferase family 2 protein [Shewanella mesophila]